MEVCNKRSGLIKMETQEKNLYLTQRIFKALDIKKITTQVKIMKAVLIVNQVGILMLIQIFHFDIKIKSN